MCCHHLFSSYLSPVMGSDERGLVQFETSGKVSDLSVRCSVPACINNYHKNICKNVGFFLIAGEKEGNMKTAVWLLCLIGLALAVQVGFFFFNSKQSHIYLFIFYLFVCLLTNFLSFSLNLLMIVRLTRSPPTLMRFVKSAKPVHSDQRL